MYPWNLEHDGKLAAFLYSKIVFARTDLEVREFCKIASFQSEKTDLLCILVFCACRNRCEPSCCAKEVTNPSCFVEKWLGDNSTIELSGAVGYGAALVVCGGVQIRIGQSTFLKGKPSCLGGIAIQACFRGYFGERSAKVPRPTGMAGTLRL